MKEFTHQTRRRISQTWVNELKERGKHLSEQEKKMMLPNIYGYDDNRGLIEACHAMLQLLEDGSFHTLSELYKNKHKKLVDVCVPKEYQEEFYYALDEMSQYQMKMMAGWERRSVGSIVFTVIDFVEPSIQLLRGYSRLGFYGVSLSDVLTGNTTPEIYDHARSEYFAYAGILAAQIDRGNEKTVQAVKDILLGEGNTAMISHELIRGIVMSRSEELYDVLGRLLLASSPQEGAGQAVCETMDAGRPEAFLHLFTVIEENNLVRYSSVKRAVSRWIGIFGEDQITDKLLRLMGQCLRSPVFCDEQLAAEDFIGISCALWAKEFYDVEDALRAVMDLINHGTKHQKIMASYFLSIQNAELNRQVAKEIILKYPDDLELAACFMPRFMDDMQLDIYFYKLVKDEHSNEFRGSKVIEPRKMQPEEIFADRGEARECYRILKKLLGRVPKKGLILSPCIFPWHQVIMSQSDIAARLCLIAWMLQDEELLDEAAGWIPLLERGTDDSNCRVSGAARLLLYRPSSEARKKILFELLHNPEEYISEEAYHLADDMELTECDFQKIEKNLKYKKGRKGTLALLQKQDSKSLAACIVRLLGEKSEECHMGALDLVLQLKKEDTKQFEEIIPQLKALPKLTRKEQVLLKELLGGESAAWK